MYEARSTSHDPRERELATLRSRIAAARSCGMYADYQLIARMDERREQLERILIAEQSSEPLELSIGDVFDTPFERGCVVLSEPDVVGNFDGLDSDGVRCSFSPAMVVAVHSGKAGA